jgi:hypothetical protein
MESKRIVLNKKIIGNESIVDYVVGYYVDMGGPNGFNYIIPIFGVINFNRISKVFINYLGSMQWINIQTERIFQNKQAIILAKNKQHNIENLKSIK